MGLELLQSIITRYPFERELTKMFENYTERAREVLTSSQDILRRYKQNQLDAEHILLALIRTRGRA